MKRSKKTWTGRVLGIVIASGLVLLAVRAFASTPVIVDMGVVTRGLLRITVEDDGRTRVRERYSISAPIHGRLLRISLRPGDAVRAARTTVAEFAPTAPDMLDARSKSQAESTLRRSEAALEGATARLRQAEIELAAAEQSLVRVRGLREQGLEAEKHREAAEHDAESAREGRRAAQYAVQVARYERDVAAASLRTPSTADIMDESSVGQAERPDPTGRLSLRSPIDGTVLRVFEESARTLTPGTPILEVGNTESLEVVADFLSQDAVRVRPGMVAIVDGWSDANEPALSARVRIVEPGGFTKTSALGVDEQRVNIVLDPIGDEQTWSHLGDGYHVEVAIVVWEGQDVLAIPAGALFRRGSAWKTYVVESGVARERMVVVGRSNGLLTEVVSGVVADTRVVLYPNDLLVDGSRVEGR